MNCSAGKPRIPWLLMAGCVISCAVFFYVARILQWDYTAKSWVKMSLFIGFPIIYWLTSGRLRRQDIVRRVFPARPPWRRLLILAGAGVLILILLNLLVEPICAFFKISSVMDEIKTRTHTNQEQMMKAMIYIPLVNALGEELFFRGFCFLELKDRGYPVLAYFFSGILFALYHLAIFQNWFSPFLLVLCLSALAGAGMILDRFIDRDRHVLGVWLLHGLVNVAILSISWRFIAS